MITEETKIQNTDLSKHIKDILSRCHIYTVADLWNLDVRRLYRIRGLGVKRIEEIKKYLSDNGYFLEF